MAFRSWADMGFTGRRVVLRVAVIVLVWTGTVSMGIRMRRVPLRAWMSLVRAQSSLVVRRGGLHQLTRVTGPCPGMHSGTWVTRLHHAGLVHSGLHHAGLMHSGLMQVWALLASTLASLLSELLSDLTHLIGQIKGASIFEICGSLIESTGGVAQV